MPDCNFLEGGVRLHWVAKWVAALKRLKTTDLGRTSEINTHIKTQKAVF